MTKSTYPRAQKTYESRANRSTLSSRPHLENVAVLNSDRANFRRFFALDRSYFVFVANPSSPRRNRSLILLRKKIGPRCGIDTRWRGSGYGYYFLLRKAFT